MRIGSTRDITRKALQVRDHKFVTLLSESARRRAYVRILLIAGVRQGAGVPAKDLIHSNLAGSVSLHHCVCTNLFVVQGRVLLQPAPYQERDGFRRHRLRSRLSLWRRHLYHRLRCFGIAFLRKAEASEHLLLVLQNLGHFRDPSDSTPPDPRP